MGGNLKILVIAPFYHTFIKGLTEALASDVEEINILVHHNVLSELAKYIPVSYSAHVTKFSRRNLVNVSQKPKNVHTHIISMLYFKPDGKNFALGDLLFKRYKSYIEKNKIQFDLIHAHFTWPSGYAAVRLAKEFGVPVVVTLHENQEWFMKLYNSRNKKIFWTWATADAIIRVNKFESELLREINRNAAYLPNGFNPDSLYPIDKKEARRNLSLPPDDKIIFSLGNIIERKGFNYFIDAIKIINSKTYHLKCYIGGSGPLKKKLMKQVIKMKLNENVTFVGFISDTDLKYWLNAADFFVLPSLSEGNPTVMFESLGVGLPFVGTKVGGIPEIINSDDYGLLVEPGKTRDLAEKIQIALNKQWDREKIREYAKQFTWENIAKRLLKVYEVVLDRVGSNNVHLQSSQCALVSRGRCRRPWPFSHRKECARRGQGDHWISCQVQAKGSRKAFVIIL